jgi:hypothetical protein
MLALIKDTRRSTADSIASTFPAEISGKMQALLLRGLPVHHPAEQVELYIRRDTSLGADTKAGPDLAISPSPMRGASRSLLSTSVLVLALQEPSS